MDIMVYKDLLVEKLCIEEDYLDQPAVSNFIEEYLHSDTPTAKYLNLKFTHDLHKGTVRHCLHNVMTPVSAISGYLELLTERLHRGAGDEKLERYSRKISEGLDEIGFLLEQLQDMYRVDNQSEGKEDYPDVDLNWLAGEVAGVINGSPKLNADKIVCRSNQKPVFIQADLFQIKLIIYNLIVSADQFTTGQSRIIMETDTDDERAIMNIRCKGKTVPNDEFIEAFYRKKTGLVTDDASGTGDSSRFEDASGVGDAAGTGDSTAAAGLLISCRMAERIGGDITLTSDQNAASPQFIYTSPLADIQ